MIKYLFFPGLRLSVEIVIEELHKKVTRNDIIIYTIIFNVARFLEEIFPKPHFLCTS